MFYQYRGDLQPLCRYIIRTIVEIVLLMYWNNASDDGGIMSTFRTALEQSDDHARASG